MGFLMGIKICPPVLMALMQIFTLHNFFSGAIFFIFFFLGTTVYFLPLSFLGFLNEFKEFQLVGRLSALIVGTSLNIIDPVFAKTLYEKWLPIPSIFLILAHIWFRF